MGMAASQARILQLSARMSNCEYEGQQINQQRTILANQSANLFNEMLTMSVPTVPSTTDYTTTQYTFSDGSNTLTIDNYYQLGTSDSDYNYVVSYSYTVSRYTGSLKKLTDPQVQFDSSSTVLTDEAYKNWQNAIYKSYTSYQDSLAEYESLTAIANDYLSDLESSQAALLSYVTSTAQNSLTYDETTGYTVTNASGSYNLTSLTTANAEIEALIKSGVLLDDESTYYTYTDANGVANYLSANDITEYYNGTSANLSSYSIDLTDSDTLYAINDYDTALVAYNSALADAQDYYDTNVTDAYNAYQTLLNAYGDYAQPTYIGNCSLTEIPIGEMTSDQLTELQQVLYDLNQDGITSNLADCFDADGNYTGGVYSFVLYGTTYYTTYADLYSSYSSVDAGNGIDGQSTLSYYSAAYVDTEISTTEKALLETDSNGRFSSIRLESDTATYTLTVETITDDDAYNDAMNQYYYETALYEKAVSDINAKTSLIQQEDQTLELRLEQLDTERNTLSTELDAVQKVLDDNIERTYKTFGD